MTQLTKQQIIENRALIMQKNFPLINHGERDGKWTTWPIEIEVFKRMAELTIEADEKAGVLMLVDLISIDVSKGNQDIGLRAFAKMPPYEIMDNRGEKVALFVGELNHDYDGLSGFEVLEHVQQRINTYKNKLKNESYSEETGNEYRFAIEALKYILKKFQRADKSV